ncbi:hypothetical protein FRC11_004198 [Ceratobasidium sp. 423]|nr:hypothetical protein FRC11_004198 [Ceratobasidium sp. 423]
MFTPHSPCDVPRIATSAHLLGTSLGKAREGVAPLDTLAPMQEVDEEQMVGIGVATAGPALGLSSPPKRGSPTGPSGLSRLIAGERERSRSCMREGGAQSPIAMDLEGGESSQGTVHSPSVSVPQERSNLLAGTTRPAYGTTRSTTDESITMADALPITSAPSAPAKLTWKTARTLIRSKIQEYTSPENLKTTLSQTMTAIPAVILGMLLNVLDGVSYGMIIFPAGDIFTGFGSIGVSMFFVTTFISQMVYTFGGSAFEGGNGSMMIEVVPFFHILTTGIIAHVGEDNPQAVVATTMVAFCLSSILTGLTFLLLGVFRLGVIIGFFPRHILVGCIGGVGWFLIETGLEVAAGINDEGGFQYTLDTFKLYFMNKHNLMFTSEYITIIAIMLCMSVYDFVIGVLFGIVLACFFFVVQNSRGQCIRALYYGDTSMSTVRRPSAHRQYLQEVGSQTAILRLQGMIFFGSVTYVESTIRQLIDIANWNKRPIRFLVVDLALVGGLDMSSAEAFVRVQRLLAVKRVTLILCGVQATSSVGKALQQVDLWADRGTGVEVFGTLNEAMEWTENVYLRAWFSSLKWRKEETQTEPVARPVRHEFGPKLPFALGASYVNSPRRSHLVNAGKRLMADADDGNGSSPAPEDAPQAFREPMFCLLKTFSSHTHDIELMQQLAAYFTRVELQAGEILWRQGDQPDGLYVIESGVLQANYDFAAHSAPVQESMTAGTLAGELSALAGSPRNATVVAERASVVWKLSTRDFERLEREQGELAKAFVRLVLKAAKTDYDVLLSALATRH